MPTTYEERQRAKMFDDPAYLCYRRVFQAVKDLPDLAGGGSRRTRAQLLEQRNVLRAAARDLIDRGTAEKRALTDDERQAFDVATDAMRQIGRELDSDEANRDGNPLDGRGGRGTIIRDKRGVEHRLLGKNDRLRPLHEADEEHSWAEEVGIGGLVRALVLGPQTDAEKRALGETPSSAGGFAVPTIVAEQVIDKLRPLNALTQAGAQTITLDAAETRFAIWSADPTFNWIAGDGGVPVDPDAKAAFGMVAFQPRTMLAIIPVGRTLFEDAPNAPAALERAIALGLANEIDRIGFNGGKASNAEPLGMRYTIDFPTIAPAGGNGAAPADYSLVLQALQTIQNANGRPPTALILNPHVSFELNNLQDTLHQPLRRPPSIEQLPFMVTSQLSQDETEGSSNVASSAYLGDFTDFWIGVRSQLSIRLLQEYFAPTNQIGIAATMRVDVATMRLGSFCRIKGLL